MAREAPYLAIDGPDPLFVSYDDAQSIALKIGYVRDQGLGGVILWELGGAYFPARAPGERNPLLDAVGAAAFGL